MGPACTPGRCPPRTPTPLHCERLTTPATGKGGARRRGGHSAKPVEDTQGAKCHLPSRCWLGGPGSPPADPTQHVCPEGRAFQRPPDARQKRSRHKARRGPSQLGPCTEVVMGAYRHRAWLREWYDRPTPTQPRPFKLLGLSSVRGRVLGDRSPWDLITFLLSPLLLPGETSKTEP